MQCDIVASGRVLICLEQAENYTLAETVSTLCHCRKILASKSFQDELQLVLLRIHLSLVDILGPQQLSRTNELGDYTLGCLCEHVPICYSPKLGLIYMNYS